MMELVPAKMFQDAKKALELMTEGVETRAGEPLVGADQFNWLDAVGRVAGFQTTQEGKVGDQTETAMRYQGWRQLRVRQLVNAYHRADDAAAKAEAIADIQRFNELNPGAPITAQSLRQSQQQKARAARERVGQGRNPDLRELLDY